MKNKKYWLDIAFKEFSYTFSSKKVSYLYFLDVISRPEYNLKRDLGMSAGGVSKLLRRTFPDRPINNGNVCTFLLKKINKKVCRNCEQVFDLSEFSINRNNSWCVYCSKIERQYNAEYYKYKAAEYRSRKLLACPEWVDKKELKNIYSQCPKGYHVDHIIPLKHELVCGLHVPWNLQYLTATENIKKKNSFKIDY